jgi:PAS domain S-box-containing protein
LQRAQTELHASNARYRGLFESARDGLLVADAATGEVVDVNPVLIELLGYSREDYIGKPLWSTRAFGNIVPNDAAFRALQAQGSLRREDAIVEAADGSQHEIDLVVSLFPGDHGLLFQCSFRDVTARLRAERGERAMRVESRVAALRFRKLFESASDGILILDATTGKLSDVNPALTTLLGYPAKSYLGMRPWELDWLTPIAADESAFEELRAKGFVRIDQVALAGSAGQTLEFRVESTVYGSGEWEVVQWRLHDITAQRQCEQTVREDEARFHALVEQQSTGVVMLGSDGSYTYVNPGMCAILGRERGEILGETGLAFVTEDALPAARKILQRQLSGDTTPIDFVTRVWRKNGEVRELNVTSTMTSFQGKPVAIGSVVDVTDRMDARRVRKRLATIVNAVDDSIVSTDCAGTIVTWNPASEDIYGYSETEAIGKDVRMLVPAEFMPAIDEMFSNMIAGNAKNLFRSEIPLIRNDGSRIDVFLSIVPLKDESGTVTGAAGVSRDVTERNAMVRSLHSSEEQFRELVEQAPEAILLFDADKDKFVLANHTALELFESSSEQLLSSGPKQFYAAEQSDALDVSVSYADHTRRVLSGESVTFERSICVSSGTEKECEVRLSLLPSSTEHLIRASFIEITQRRRAEKKVARGTRALKALSAANEAVVHATDEITLLQKLCDLLVDVGGYAFAWIGVPEVDENKNIRALAHAGSDDGYLADVQTSWGDAARSKGPTHRAMRTGEMQVDAEYDDVRTRPWREEARKRGFLSAIALPLKIGSGPFTVLTIYAGDADAFDAEELGLLSDLVDDLAFGIVGIRNSDQHKVAVRKLQENMELTVRAIASTLELRDPYTAGHQRRVGMLAGTIARELGFSEDRAHSVYLAGVVHDIGKITVPAEILSKPGRLTSTEFDLIRVHAEAGYGILKDIAFPWPLPEMVRQHHERLDGSGYPRGLTSAQMLPEAKILAVADVMEAMLAHRPYRPSRGLEAALAEIERGRGSIYDPDAADACLSLFREKGFTFDYEQDRASGHL